MSNIRPLLSVIVPVYNKELYIDTCLHSILEACNLKETEIILIDDGSTDNSGIILDQFKTEHDNVYIIVQHTINHGVSAARNMGISIARGEYIAFVDADDEVLKNSFVSALSIHDNSVDMYICGAIWEGGNPHLCDLKDRTINQDGNIDCFSFFLTGGAKGKTIQAEARKYMWGCKEKFYKKEFLDKNYISFDERLSRNEDVLFSLECYYAAKIIRFLPINVYINKKDPKGLTSSMNADKNYYNFITFYDIFNGKFRNSMSKEDMSLFYFQHTLTFIKEIYLALKKHNINIRKYRELLYNYFHRDDIVEMISYMPLKKLSKPKLIAYLLMRVKLYPLVYYEMTIYDKSKVKST